jgi:hypothetical protein
VVAVEAEAQVVLVQTLREPEALALVELVSLTILREAELLILSVVKEVPTPHTLLSELARIMAMVVKALVGKLTVTVPLVGLESL